MSLIFKHTKRKVLITKYLICVFHNIPAITRLRRDGTSRHILMSYLTLSIFTSPKWELYSLVTRVRSSSIKSTCGLCHMLVPCIRALRNTNNSGSCLALYTSLLSGHLAPHSRLDQEHHYWGQNRVYLNHHIPSEAWSDDMAIHLARSSHLCPYCFYELLLFCFIEVVKLPEVLFGLTKLAAKPMLECSTGLTGFQIFWVESPPPV